MERKIITYKGINLVPSDISAPDGTLCESINLISRNEEIVPIVPPKMIFESSGTILGIHKTPLQDYYFQICESNNQRVFRYFYLDTNGEPTGETQLLSLGQDEQIINISFVGNTVIVSFLRLGLYYLLLKNDSYKTLGSKPPFLDISFGLTSSYKELDCTANIGGTFEWKGGRRGGGGGYSTMTESQSATMINSVLGNYNKFIQEEVEDKNRFIMPFFVRYAYRLYDGSTYMASSPVLITPSTWQSMLASAEVDTHNHTSGTVIMPHHTFSEYINYKIQGYSSTLDYKIMNSEDIEKWSDIVHSIDIFVSDPIYNYDQNTQSADIEDPSHYQSSDYNDCYLKSNIVEIRPLDIYQQSASFPSLVGCHAIFPVNKSKEDITAELEKKSIFYQISTIEIKDIPETHTREKVDIKEGVLSVLQTQTALQDDYNTHNTIFPKYSYVYNGRLNIANYSELPFRGFSPISQSAYTNGKTLEHTTTKYNYTIYVFLKEQGEEFVLKSHSNEYLCDIGAYLFYPNPNAYKMVIKRRLITQTGNLIGWEDKYTELQLKKHKNLNGAFWFDGFRHPIWSDIIISATHTTTHISSENKLMQSEINNPFYFPLANINTVTNGEIVGIASTTSALSQGQFGQFPLYVFTTEGIWAMNTTDSGTYSFKQIVSRDVCNNPKSITQIDGAIVFTNSRGLMIIIGSEVTELSAVMTGKTFDPKTLTSSSCIEPFSEAFDTCSFLDYIQGVKIAYNYNSSMLMLINPTKSYQYIYDIKYKSFAKTFGVKYIDAINNYPDTLLVGAVKEDTLTSCVYSMFNTESINNYKLPIKGIIITRPIKFDNALALKTINRCIHKGVLAKGSTANHIIYASRDNAKYFKLASYYGVPFGYYRFIFQTSLIATDSIAFTACDVVAKHTNKMR